MMAISDDNCNTTTPKTATVPMPLYHITKPLPLLGKNDVGVENTITPPPANLRGSAGKMSWVINSPNKTPNHSTISLKEKGITKQQNHFLNRLV